jgi:hypothetical protein
MYRVLKYMDLKIEFASTLLVTFLAVTSSNYLINCLGVLATIWALLNQFYLNKKRVERDFKGSWRAYFVSLTKFKKRKNANNK